MGFSPKEKETFNAWIFKKDLNHLSLSELRNLAASLKLDVTLSHGSKDDVRNALLNHFSSRMKEELMIMKQKRLSNWKNAEELEELLSYFKAEEENFSLDEARQWMNHDQAQGKWVPIPKSEKPIHLKRLQIKNEQRRLTLLGYRTPLVTRTRSLPKIQPALFVSLTKKQSTENTNGLTKVLLKFGELITKAFNLRKKRQRRILRRYHADEQAATIQLTYRKYILRQQLKKLLAQSRFENTILLVVRLQSLVRHKLQQKQYLAMLKSKENVILHLQRKLRKRKQMRYTLSLALIRVFQISIRFQGLYLLRILKQGNFKSIVDIFLKWRLVCVKLLKGSIILLRKCYLVIKASNQKTAIMLQNCTTALTHWSIINRLVIFYEDQNIQRKYFQHWYQNLAYFVPQKVLISLKKKVVCNRRLECTTKLQDIYRSYKLLKKEKRSKSERYRNLKFGLKSNCRLLMLQKKLPSLRIEHVKNCSYVPTKKRLKELFEI